MANQDQNPIYDDKVTPLRGELARRGPLPPREPPDDPMNVRVARLEEAVKGLREHINIVLGVIAIVVLILLYGIGRVDQLSEKVSDLPGKISSELRDITKTLADSITAAKQQAPPIILIPAPPVQMPPQTEQQKQPSTPQ